MLVVEKSQRKKKKKKQIKANKTPKRNASFASSAKMSVHISSFENKQLRAHLLRAFTSSYPIDLRLNSSGVSLDFAIVETRWSSCKRAFTKKFIPYAK